MNQGEKRMREILGEKSEQIIKTLRNISPDFADYVVNYAYGDIYSREPGLPDKAREVAVVANLMGQGNTGLPLKLHLRGMLNVGWTQNEVLELLIFLSSYNGFPTSVGALLMAKEIFDEWEEE